MIVLSISIKCLVEASLHFLLSWSVKGGLFRVSISLAAGIVASCFTVFAQDPTVANEYLRGKKLYEAGQLVQARAVWSSLLQDRRSELTEAQVKALTGRVAQVDKVLDQPLVKARNAYWQGRKLGADGGPQLFATAEKEALKALAADKKSTEAAFLAASSILRQPSLNEQRLQLAFKLGKMAVETEPGRTDELLKFFPKGELWDKLDGFARNIRIERRQQTIWGDGSGGGETDRLLKENVAGVKYGGRIFKKKAYTRGNYRK